MKSGAMRRSLARIALVTLAAVGAATFSTSSAWAQADESANMGTAIALFEEAKKLQDGGKYAEAIPKLEQTLTLISSGAAMFRLAECYEKVGRTGSAWTMFKRANLQAKKDGKPDLASDAATRATALEPQLSKLTVQATKVPGMTVKQNGQDVPLAGLGVGLPVDPGEITVEASAPGYKLQTVKVTVGANADAKSVTIPPLEKEIIVPPPGTEDSGSMKTLGYVLGGVGIAGLGLGGAMGFLAMGDKNDAADDPALCPDQKCTPAGREKIDSAESKALISTIGFGVGAAALGAGIVILVMSGGDDKEAAAPAQSAQVLPSFDANGGGLSVVGQF